MKKLNTFLLIYMLIFLAHLCGDGEYINPEVEDFFSSTEFSILDTTIVIENIQYLIAASFCDGSNSVIEKAILFSRNSEYRDFHVLLKYDSQTFFDGKGNLILETLRETDSVVGVELEIQPSLVEEYRFIVRVIEHDCNDLTSSDPYNLVYSNKTKIIEIYEIDWSSM